MLRTIKLGGRELPYELQRKRVKNINLRVRSDGSIYVSAPPAVTVERIESFIRSNEQRILKAEAKAEGIARPPHRYEQGESFTVLGEERVLHLYSGRKNEAVLGRNEIALTVKDAEDAAAKERAVERLLRALCQETVEGLCAEAYRYFQPLGVSRPEIRFRRMKSRWGSCNAAGGVLTFNTELIAAPLECIEYVVYHEFTHFLHQNHSQAFYEALSVYIPDWKALRKRLSQYSAGLGR